MPEKRKHKWGFMHRKTPFDTFLEAFTERYGKHLNNEKLDEPDMVSLFCEFKASDIATPDAWFEQQENS